RSVQNTPRTERRYLILRFRLTRLKTRNFLPKQKKSIPSGRKFRMACIQALVIADMQHFSTGIRDFIACVIYRYDDIAVDAADEGGNLVLLEILADALTAVASPKGLGGRNERCTGVHCVEERIRGYALRPVVRDLEEIRLKQLAVLG